MNNHKIYFRFSKYVVACSAICTVAFGLLVYYLAVEGSLACSIFSVLSAALWLCLLGAMPIYLQNEEECFVLRTVFFKKRLSKKDYAVELVDKTALDGSIRVFASGGLFGYTGLFHSKGNGFFYCYLSNLKDPMLKFSKEKGKTIFVSFCQKENL